MTILYQNIRMDPREKAFTRSVVSESFVGSLVIDSVLNVTFR